MPYNLSDTLSEYHRERMQKKRSTPEERARLKALREIKRITKDFEPLHRMAEKMTFTRGNEE